MTTLYDIARWAKNDGLVGEEKAFLICTAALVTNKPLGVLLNSAAGAGKTEVVDRVVGDETGGRPSIIDSDLVYFKDQASATATSRDAHKINKKRIMAMKELQKDKTHDSIETMKSMTEGKSAIRKVTNMAKWNEDTGENGAVETFEINPMPVIGCLAIENDHKLDTELARRCITVTTDVSKKQTAEVLKVKAGRQWDVSAHKIMTDEEASDIQKDVRALFMEDFEVANPFAPAFAEIVAEIAPDQKARSTIGHFFNVMEGVVKINAMEHPFYVDGGNTILATVQDFYQTLDIYLDSFIRDVHGIPPMGEIVLQGFRDAEADSMNNGEKRNSGNLATFTGQVENVGLEFKIVKIREMIKKKQNITLKTAVVREICRALVDAGYLEDNKDGSTLVFRLADEFKVISYPKASHMIDEAAALVSSKYPEIYDKWRKFQDEGYTHPITGEQVKLNSQ